MTSKGKSVSAAKGTLFALPNGSNEPNGANDADHKYAKLRPAKPTVIQLRRDFHAIFRTTGTI